MGEVHKKAYYFAHKFIRTKMSAQTETQSVGIHSNTIKHLQINLNPGLELYYYYFICIKNLYNNHTICIPVAEVNQYNITVQNPGFKNCYIKVITQS